MTVTAQTKDVACHEAGSHLWGPWLDALLLGGLSVVAFVVLQVVQLSAIQAIALAGAMTALAHVINHPHFAHSYQIFYSAWTDIMRSNAAWQTRWRWAWAGVVAPLAIIVLLAIAAYRAVHGDTIWIGLCISAMGLLVGWHYVKQGFGMAMTDAAVKRSFWPTGARQALLTNAYVCWFTAWFLINLSEAGRLYWGYFAWRPAVPTLIVGIGIGICLLSTGWTTIVVLRAMRVMATRAGSLRKLPIAGLLAYVVTLYLWTVFAAADPAYLLMIPFFHSLQYLTVVWRYKTNEWRATRAGSVVRLRFVAIGLVLGAAGFWWAPVALDGLRTGEWSFDPKGPAIAIASFWLFINVHHYVIDNVLWRKDNPRVGRYLFGQTEGAR